jgi:tetratricopeptide (TPR) repeat protein
VVAALANDRGILTSAGAVDADKVEILELALDRLSTDSPDRALMLATLCSELAQGSPLDRRQALADEAIAIARSSGDDAVIVRVLNHVFLPLNVPSLLERSLARTADALVRAERVGDPLVLLWAADFRYIAAVSTGDIHEVDRCIEIIGSMAEQLDQPTLNWLNTFIPAARAMIAGDTDQAELLAHKALQIGTDGGQPDAVTFFGVQLMSLNAQRGTLSELVPLIEQAIADNPGLPTLKPTLALAHAEGDRIDSALQLLAEIATTDFDFPLDMTWLTGIVRCADVAIECHDAQYAQRLFDRLAPWADQWTHSAGLSSQGPVSLYLGGLKTVLGRYDEADAFFSQSAALSDRMGAKFFTARTHLLWGRMLAERSAPGDTEKARELLTRSQNAASAHGYRSVARRAAAALQLLGALKANDGLPPDRYRHTFGAPRPNADHAAPDTARSRGDHSTIPMLPHSGTQSRRAPITCQPLFGARE